MRISRDGNSLVIADRPGCLWGLGVWFIAGGMVGIAMLFVATNAHELQWWERVLVVVVSLGCAAGGVYTLRTAPAIQTVLDRDRDVGHMRIRRLGAREELQFRCRDVILVEIHQDTDSDGDPCYQLRLGLKSGRPLPLHSVLRHDREGCERQKREIHDYLGLA